VVAAIEGYCFGGGALVAVAADIRIASSSARISLPPAKLGLVYPASSIRHLVALVGPSRAKLLLLTAEIVDAHQALEFGLVDRVLSPETFDDGVLRLTQSISRGSALTQASTKRLVETCIDRPADLEAERDRWHSLALSSGELAEGIASFIEKRPPAFRWTSGGLQSG
jgi:enoyl-CoA hydratase/carnithine racemase